MSGCRWTFAIVTWFLLLTAAKAQTSTDPDPLFRSSDVLNVRIVAPFDTVLTERSDEVEVEGKFHFASEAGEPIVVDVSLRTRGRYRLKKNICKFPPLRLNFKTSQTKDSLFRKQDKVKLVTHCQDGSSRYEQTLLREYVAYRILNELTDASFRVRLLKITYEDSDGHDEDRIRYGFMIEHKDRLAKRLGLEALEIPGTTTRALRPEYLNLISVYHYLIGNTDFSPVAGADANCCHNHVLLGKDRELMLSVPYDFDQSGLVSAPHGITNPRFRLRSSKQRLYRGRCINNPHLEATVATYLDKREAILKLTSEQEGVTPSSAKSMTRFVEQFYKTIASPKRVNREFAKRCI